MYFGLEVFEDFDHGSAALAEAGEDERSAAVEVFEIVCKGFSGVAHGQG